MKPIAILTMAALILAAEVGIAQNAKAKPIDDDQARKIAMEKVGAGAVEFIERKSDGVKTVYDVYMMRGDTLITAVVNGHTSEVDSINIDPETGRKKLQARQLGQARAQAAAMKEVAGEVMRWKLRKFGAGWCYRLHIETPDGKWKEVYVSADTYEVFRVKEHDIAKLDN